MADQTASPLGQFAKGLLTLIQQRLREKAHTQLVIVIRDGHIQLIREDRTYLPDNLPIT
jgi:hypothetical protein